MKQIIASLFWCAALVAAESPDSVAYFSALWENTSTTAESLGVQLPANSQQRVYGVAAAVYCSAGCEVAQKLDASLAGTAVTPVALSARGAAPAASVLRSVTPTGGSALPSLTVSAGGTAVIDLTPILLPAGRASAGSYLLSASGSSGTIRIAIVFYQK
jgi:hypothetical protein